MVNVKKEICTMGIPRMVVSTEYICDECGCRCEPKSTDVQDHLFRTKRGDFCWECLMDEYSIDDVI